MATHASESAPVRARSAFVRARLASFLAFAPLSVWTVIHVWNNLSAFDGAAAWQKAVTEYPSPVAQVVTWTVVLFPLALHTIWGLGRIATTRPNNLRYGFYANLKYALQRLSALGVLAFLGAHLWLAFIRPRWVEGHAETFADISREMRFHTPTLVVYLLGTLGVAYHIANGLHGMAMGWGAVSSKRALQRLEGVTIALFLALLAMSWAAIYAVWKAG